MNKLLCILYCAVTLCIVTNPIFGFNVDLPSALELNGEAHSMFGFSIALHKYRQDKWVIIGAPKKETSNFQPNVIEGGAVYRCDMFGENRCHLIPFDIRGDTYSSNEKIDRKSYQWFGATVATGGDGSPIIACAPRYVFHTMQPSRVERVEPVGTCFTSSADFSNFTQFSPCRTSNWGYHRQGSCQAGFSAAISKNNDRLFIGAPGSWYWQGQVFSIHPDSRYPYKPPQHEEFGSRGQAYSYDVTDARSRVYASGESHPSDDDSYLGYSMVTGYLNQNKNGPEDIAIGMPRGADLRGKVVIFSWDILNPLNISGLQIGEYFGYSLCVVDVNGDGLDDLIVGAPMHAEDNNENKYDVGRIYIMLQARSAVPFSNYVHRDGFRSRGRFGLALTKLGDINRDGYGDFAVGAPYDGPEKNGVVYIYHGSENGPLEKPSQIIHAEDVSFKQRLSTFGFSLAGGMDLDNNEYPDFAVGAYGSDAIVVLRSRPVANVVASTKFVMNSKVINLDEKRCSLRNGVRVTCANYISCIRYNGINLPATLDFDIYWTLDAKKPKQPRMFLLENEERSQVNLTTTLFKERDKCFNQTVYIKHNAADIQDKLTPLEVEMTYSPRKTNFYRNKRELEPVIDQNKDTTQRDSIIILKNCGPDDVCIPNLKLKTRVPDKFILGSKLPFEIDVSVPNVGEDAFETAFYMTIPEGLNYKNIKQPEDSRDVTITCSETNNVLKCNLGNPLPANKNANFKVILAPYQKDHKVLSPSYEFFMEVNSTNPELEGSKFDNIEKKVIEKTIDAELVIHGASQSESIYYKPSDYKSLENSTKEADVGPSVVHFYSIQNNGPASIDEAVVLVYWPYKTISGDDLMYLMTEPETVGNIKCDPSFNLNPRKLETEKNSSSLKYFLKARGAVEYEATNENSLDVSKTQSGGSSAVVPRVLTKEEERTLEDNQFKSSVGDSSSDQQHRSHSTVRFEENSTHYSIPAGASTSQSSSQIILPGYVQSSNNDNLHGQYGSQHGSGHGSQHGRQYDSQHGSQYGSQQGSQSYNSNSFRTGSIDLGTQNNHNMGNSRSAPQQHYVSTSNYYSPPQYISNRNELIYQPRTKRETLEQLCQRTQCVTLRCVAKNLVQNDVVYIAMRMRLVVETLEKLSENAPINISTMGVAHITQFPYIGAPVSPKLTSYEIVFQAIPESSLESGIVPLWVVILSACAGAIILLLLIFLLYKCGFFKRNRPSGSAQERQPLNRNGYHGDEHL